MADPLNSPSAHWRKAQRFIKALFLQEKYRQCIQVCRDVLKATADDDEPHPLQDAYANFYLGLCHHEVARIMHPNSVAKLPAYGDAERHYLEALTALPTVKDARALCTRPIEEALEDPFVEQKTDNDFLVSPSITDSGFFDKRCSRASSLMLSSPPRHPGAENISFDSPFSSPARTTSDMEDLESHHSFAELMTPNRVQHIYSTFDRSMPVQSFLPREVSRISLVGCSPQYDGLPRDASRVSLFDAPSAQPQPAHGGGLRKPIRMGPPAMPFQIPPRMPYSGAFQRQQLPTLATHARSEARMSAPQMGSYSSGQGSSDIVSPVSPIALDSPMSHASSVSPISSIATDGRGERGSETSAISGIPPDTPPPMKHHKTPATTLASVSFQPKGHLDIPMLGRLTEHLTAMRAQLEKHMQTVQQAQEQIHRAQALQKLSRPISAYGKGATSGASSVKSSSLASSPIRQKSLQKSRSFWSFAPEDQKARKKRERIEAGRERKWHKDRFDPSKYRNLCDEALAEL